MKRLFAGLMFYGMLLLQLQAQDAPSYTWQLGVKGQLLADRVALFSESGFPTYETAWSTTGTIGLSLQRRFNRNWSLFSEINLYQRQLPRQTYTSDQGLDFAADRIMIPVALIFVEGSSFQYQIPVGIQKHFSLSKKEGSVHPEFTLGLGVALQGYLYQDLTFYRQPIFQGEREQRYWETPELLPLARAGFQVDLKEKWGLGWDLSLQANRLRNTPDWYYFTGINLLYRL
ncbi:MAG: hypothetical protein AAFR61_07915 [Bacteroidota bacterium]